MYPDYDPFPAIRRHSQVVLVMLGGRGTLTQSAADSADSTVVR